ncbi:hypothetical protein GNF18_10330 [Ligilactobacillus pobuzihii]|uniref:hypothetical protein n=1 Tax=Ligilactobacillus pobuzihii TaxID=449659 RepID=UPI0019D24CF4|nr:hypothetical protein [Ligilactobacillus pobuzihii]MBN7275537.1 hypothetical protein [Ligilactobacillus pobuzihii]
MKQEYFKIRRLAEPHQGEIAEVTVFPNGSYQITGKNWGSAGPGPIDDLFKHGTFERLPEELDIFDCLEEIKKEDSL